MTKLKGALTSLLIALWIKKLNITFQLIKYIAIGFLTAALYFLSFGFFLNFINFSYKISLSIAYILAIIIHFVGNCFLFKSYNQPMIHQMMKYSFLVLINYIITLLTVICCIEMFQVSPYLSIIISVGLTVGIGYTLSSLWIFR